jgi:hypothetical protein
VKASVRFAAAATVISCDVDGPPIAGALLREQLSESAEARIIRMKNLENECEELMRENSDRITDCKTDKPAITLLLTSVF